MESRLESVISHLAQQYQELEDSKSTTKKACYDTHVQRYKSESTATALLVERLKATVADGQPFVSMFRFNVST